MYDYKTRLLIIWFTRLQPYQNISLPRVLIRNVRERICKAYPDKGKKVDSRVR